MSYRPYNTIKSTGINLGYTNASGVTMDKATPVRQTSSGDIDFVDVSVEADVLGVLGLVATSILNGAKGSVATQGKVENVIITGNFGDPVFISKTGGLTTTKPSLGVGGFVAGDWVIAIGVIAKNEDNPLLKDIVLFLDVRGQLA